MALPPSEISKIIISLPSASELSKARKLLEICLAETDMTADIIVGRKNQRRAPESNKGAGKMNTIFLKSTNENVTYAQVIKGMSDSINPEEMGITVKTMKETRGILALSFKSTKEGASTEFLGKVKAAIGPGVTCQEKSRTLIIQEIEAGVDEDDVHMKLSTLLSCAKEAISLGKIFLNQRGSRTLFITMEESLARRALDLRSIPMGWTRATIREKIVPDQCANCHLYGHRHGGCKNPTSGKRCRNCGKEGHIRKDCPNETYCCACSVKGHRYDSMACPVYRHAVNSKKQ